MRAPCVGAAAQSMSRVRASPGAPVAASAWQPAALCGHGVATSRRFVGASLPARDLVVRRHRHLFTGRPDDVGRAGVAGNLGAVAVRLKRRGHDVGETESRQCPRAADSRTRLGEVRVEMTTPLQVDCHSRVPRVVYPQAACSRSGRQRPPRLRHLGTPQRDGCDTARSQLICLPCRETMAMPEKCSVDRIVHFCLPADDRAGRLVRRHKEQEP